MSTIPTSVTEEQFTEYLALSEYSQTGVCMPNPVIQSLQLHPISAAYGLPVERIADSAQPARRDKKEISWQAVYYHFRKWSADGSLEKSGRRVFKLCKTTWT